MNGHGHSKVVKLAFECFPTWLQKTWKAYEGNVEETCMFPDKYAVHMLEGKTGPWRKYFPAIKSTHVFHFHQQSFRKSLPPLRFYINKVIAHIRQRKMVEAARFAGVFSHHIADFSQPAHYYELDIQKLLPPPKSMANCNLHPMIENIESRIHRISYKARPLGTSEDEFEFYLETRFAKLYKKALASIVPMVTFIYQKKNAKAQRIFDEVIGEVVKTFADFCYTSFIIALDRFPNREVSRFDECDLREIEPYSYDVEYNYGHKPLIDTITTTTYGRAKVLTLLKKQGNRKVSKLTRGICTVPHALPLKGTTASATLEYRLPKKAYSRFKTTVGLYADIEKQAKCRFEVIADEKSLYKSKMLTPEDTGQLINIDISGCEKLKLVARTDGSTDKLSYPIWGEPRLVKK